jgi:uncharacterized protein
MHQYYKVKSNTGFVGREFERQKLINIENSGEAAIVIVHGRRRVGKTELIEQHFAKRNLLKFEGREGQSSDVQKRTFLEALSIYLGQSALAMTSVESWRQVLRILAESVKKGKWTIFLEEFQWLCCYDDELISELKFFWDNHFRHNPHLILVLCGSSPSFMVNKVIKSKALYNRSQHEIALKQFSLSETKEFLGARFSDLMTLNTHLSIGGLPEYLKKIRQEGAVVPGLVKNSFLPGSFFSTEKIRVFVSALSESSHYERIVDVLASHRYMTRDNLLKTIGIGSGGSSTKVFEDLIACGFIDKYHSFQSEESTRNQRLRISDPYLNFYFKFIAPKMKGIESRMFLKHPESGLNLRTYEQFLGFSFERFMVQISHHLATILGFSAIEYRAGSYFRRSTLQKSFLPEGFQLDYVFERADHVFTLCEFKHTQKPLDLKIAKIILGRMELFDYKPKNARQRVLIATAGVTSEVKNSGIFDRILTLKDLF